MKKKFKCIRGQLKGTSPCFNDFSLAYVRTLIIVRILLHDFTKERTGSMKVQINFTYLSCFFSAIIVEQLACKEYKDLFI